MTPALDTDYRDPGRREHFVYRAYDAVGVLLYVGCTNRPRLRWKEQRAWSNDGWTKRARRFRVSGPYNYDTGRRLEREAIRTENPLHNGDAPAVVAAKRERKALVDELIAEWIGWGADEYTAIRVAGAIADEVKRVQREGEPGEQVPA